MGPEANGNVLRAEIDHLTAAVRETNQCVKDLGAEMQQRFTRFEQSQDAKFSALWDRLTASQGECNNRHLKLVRDTAMSEVRLGTLEKAGDRQHETDRDQNAAISWVKERVVAILALIALVVDIGLRLSGKIG